MIDLFEHYENLPIEINKLIDRLNFSEPEYNKLEKLNKEFNYYGFNFEYDLSAEPIELNCTAEKFELINNNWTKTEKEITEKTKLIILYNDDLKPYGVGMINEKQTIEVLN